MIIYNVTINVEDDIHDEWVDWMKNVHIPEVLDTGHFTHHYFARILSRQEDETGVTYAIQYHCKSMDDFDTYQKVHAPGLQKEVADKYPGKFVAFRTVLEKI